MQYALREASSNDDSALVALDRLSVEERSVGQLTIPCPAVGFLDLARSNGHPDARCFVAVDQTSERIVGSALVDVEKVTWNGEAIAAGYLFRLRVHPGFRREGVARALTAQVESAALVQGAQVTWVAVVEGNRASRAFSHSTGYHFGTRIEYKAVPLLPHFRVASSPGRTVAQPLTAGNTQEAEDLRGDFWRDHQLWARRDFTLTTKTYVALDSGGRVRALADCFEEFRVARVENLGMKGLPMLVNRLVAPIANRFASRYVFVRDLAFKDGPAACDLLNSLAVRYRGKADFLVVGADARSEAQTAIRKLPGIPGWVDLLIKTGAPTDKWRSYHLVLG